jgi:hypothetical protein
MDRHLYPAPRPQEQRPAKRIQLEVRRQLRREARRPRSARPLRRPR